MHQCTDVAAVVCYASPKMHIPFDEEGKILFKLSLFDDDTILIISLTRLTIHA